MKKLTTILKGCNLVDKLFSLREKEINRKIEGAKTIARDARPRQRSSMRIIARNWVRKM